ncbi:MAG: tetratricopeptide repeat protein [Magnetospirillum sp.]|nr:tetratricopeptide repeat protein [Magnetospirillum sp.]
MDELDEILAARPVDEGRAEAFIEQATLARRSGDPEGALAAYRQALTLEPTNATLMLECAGLERALGRPRAALRSCLLALDVEPRNVEARVELATTLVALGRLDEAHAVHALLVRDHAHEASGWYSLARLLAGEGRGAAAEACFRRAAALAPGHAGARLGIARALVARGRMEAAAEACHDALALAPDDADSHAVLASALLALGCLDEAGDRLERALALDDDHVQARLQRSRLRQLRGDLVGAGDDNEWRWHLPGRRRPTLGAQPWEGGSVEGQTILVHAEAGISDTIQYARYVTMLAERGAKVVMVVHPRLVLLMGQVKGRSRVFPAGMVFPPDLTYDLTASLVDLPRLCGSTLDTLPAEPYLSAPADSVQPIGVPPGIRLKVGLVWSGGGTDPSFEVPFTDLLGLAEIEGVALFSLQNGPRAAMVEALAHPSLITDLDPTILDFADVAGRISEMDLVIAADSPAAHIAGAMGKPVWLMAAKAADPRWLAERDDSPWYPGMRLFRQEQAGQWRAVIERVRAELATLAAPPASAAGEERNEEENDDARRTSGPVAKLRTLLDSHLRAGDLFIDIEAGDGTFTLDAATHPAGDIKVLALEPRAADAEFLRDSLGIAGVEDGVVDVVVAAVGDRSGHALVAKIARDGRRVYPVPEWVPGAVPVVALDTVLAERPEAASRRVVMRLGQAGWEEHILDGLWEWLALGHIAALVWEHRSGSDAAEMVAGLGYAVYRFPTAVATGALVEFHGEPGPVLALAPGIEPLNAYGDTAPAAAPVVRRDDSADSRQKAARLAAEGVEHHRIGRLGEAVRAYGRALVEDPFNPMANANLAVVLRMNGRHAAAAACCRRALVRGPMPGVSSNLTNALRELDRIDEAGAAIAAALAAAPDNPEYLFNHALVLRRQGRDREAAAVLERLRTLQGRGYGWDLAQARMKAGLLTEGFELFGARRKPILPAGLAELPEWEGDDPAGRSILVHDEGDVIDTLMFARYIPLLAARGALVTVSCPAELASLLAPLPGVEAVVTTGDKPPPCDLRAALLDLPRLVGATARNVPYLHRPDDTAPRRLSGRGLKVGLSWGGRPRDRNCLLADMLALAAHPKVSLFSLEHGERKADLAAAGARAFVEDLGRRDYGESAAAIAALDLVVAGDTAQAHLASALGKPVWVLLPRDADWRWPHGRSDSPWYPSMRLFHQSPDGSWDEALARVLRALDAVAAGK